MARVKRSVIAKRQVDMLAFFRREAEACGEDPVPLSLKVICTTQGLSPAQTRRTLIALREAGYLVVVSRKLSNGGTAENAYGVTSAGCRVLAANRSENPLLQEAIC